MVCHYPLQSTPRGNLPIAVTKAESISIPSHAHTHACALGSPFFLTDSRACVEQRCRSARAFAASRAGSPPSAKVRTRISFAAELDYVLNRRDSFGVHAGSTAADCRRTSAPRSRIGDGGRVGRPCASRPWVKRNKYVRRGRGLYSRQRNEGSNWAAEAVRLFEKERDGVRALRDEKSERNEHAAAGRTRRLN